MRYTELIFDLYGTLVDIHTEENDAVWEKTALYFGFYGAAYTPRELKDAFHGLLRQREAAVGQSYECYPDIPVEQIMAALFRAKGTEGNCDTLGIQAAQLFRIASIEYIRLYPHVKEALSFLRKQGCRLWLLSNAQQVFTSYELRLLGLDRCFDGIYLSSDYGCRKPDPRFFRALLQDQKLDLTKCLMIGNDLQTDIAGAKNAGLATLYMHTGLTPPEQRKADPGKFPGQSFSHGDWEYEGSDWQELPRLLTTL